MTNVFATFNYAGKTNTKIGNLEAGRVFFFKDHTFVKLAKPFGSGTTCSNCGSSETWNAHNFVAAVHFCPTEYYDFEVTEFVVDFPQKT